MNATAFSLAAFVFSVITAIATAPSSAQQRSFVPVEALRRGGYVLLFRHAASTEAPPEPSSLDLSDCSVQYRLTDAGRADARAIGAAVRMLDIPLGQVLASPYCRAMDTARLAFGRVERWDALLPPPYAPVPGQPAPLSYPRRLDTVKQFIATPIAGPNIALITHSGIARDAWGLAMDQGEAVIFRADGRGGSVLVARVLPAGWTSAADAQRSR